MANLLAFLSLAALVGVCYFIYQRSVATAGTADERDQQRFMIANRELHLERIDHATWDQAIRIANGDEGVARARYLQLRVEQMKREDAAKAAQQS